MLEKFCYKDAEWREKGIEQNHLAYKIILKAYKIHGNSIEFEGYTIQEKKRHATY